MFTAALVTPAMAGGAVLTVDDDAVQCPSAGFSTIQAAVDAASSGDTVAVCQGTYSEGTGGPGTNGLTISKPLTLYGAGAGVVTIQPSAQNGGSIADVGSTSPVTAPPLLRNDTGNIIDVTAGPTNITGVRIRSNGVETEAGVVFHNASGVFRNSQITDLWNNAQFPRPTGVGLLAAADDGQSHPIVLRRSIVQGYNVAGVLLDANSTSTGSSIEASIDEARVQGAGRQDEQQQDGIRLEDGASATITNVDIDSNFFKPDQSKSAGVRLVGAGVAAMRINGNNIQGNGYGLMNMDSADLNAATGPDVLNARSNWWGDSDGPCAQAVLPALPDCPTTGDAVTSPFVDFGGWFTDPVISAQTWGSESDANPTVKITSPSDGATLKPNVSVPVNASAADDLAVQSVTFTQGTTVLGEDRSPPYQVTYKPGVEQAGTSQVIVATARDALGHRSSDQISVEIEAPPAPPFSPGEVDAPPTVKLTTPEDKSWSSSRSRLLIKATADDDIGVGSVTFVVGGRQACVDSSAPYECRFTPTSENVGHNSVLAVATDSVGQTASDLRHVRISRFRPRALTLSATPRRDSSDPFEWTARGKLRMPAGVSRADGCAIGSVAIQYQVGRTTFDTRRTRLKKNCSYSESTRFHIGRRLLGRKKVRVVATFQGNVLLTKLSSRQRFTLVG